MLNNTLTQISIVVPIAALICLFLAVYAIEKEHRNWRKIKRLMREGRTYEDAVISVLGIGYFVKQHKKYGKDGFRY